MSRYWVRFYGGVDGDPRPLAFLTPIEWWCTGEREDSPPNVICAIVDAESEVAAREEIAKAGHWPEAVHDSCTVKAADWRPSSDRFPSKRAMV